MSQPFTWNDQRAPEPARHVAFVRSYDNSIAFEDHRLASLVSVNVGAGKRWTSIDIVMQQCFSGGFANNFSALTASPYTLTMASDWNEVAYTVQEAPGFTPAVENFTRAWVEVPALRVNPGRREAAFEARERDWTGPVDTNYNPNVRSHPQYQSADPAPGGANDTRSLEPGQNERVFTGIGLFGAQDRIAFRHFTNALRVASRMRGYSAGEHVKGIYGNGFAQAISIDGAVRPDIAELPELRTPASSAAASVDSIFAGDLFGGQAQAGDRLVFYVTGHGARAQFGQSPTQIFDSNNDTFTDSQRVRISNPFALQQREAGGQPYESFNPNMFGDSDDTPGSEGVFEIQLSLTSVLDPGAEVWINGMNLTASLVIVPLAIARELPNESATLQTPDPSVVYQVFANRELVFTTQPFIDVEFRNIGGLAANSDLLLGASFWSGDTECVHVNIPAPGIATLLLAIGATALPRRCRPIQLRG